MPRLSQDEDEQILFRDILKAAKHWEESKKAYHFLMQTLLKNPVVTKKYFYVTWMQYVVEIIMHRTYDDFVRIKCDAEDLDGLCQIIMDATNTRISKTGIRVTEYPNEVTGDRYIVLTTNISFSNCLTLASKYTADERFLLQSFVGQIVASDDGYLERNEAIFAGHELPNPLGPTKVIALLERLVGEYWLENEDGKYTLGVRGAAELTNKIIRKYEPNICQICDRIVIRKKIAVNCPKCNEGSHRLCFKMMSIVIAVNEVPCPNKNCKHQFDKTAAFRVKNKRGSGHSVEIGDDVKSEEEVTGAVDMENDIKSEPASD